VKIDKSNYKLFKLEELDRKYSEIFEKLKEILDNRYTKKKKNKLKLGLKKLRDS